MAARPAPSPAAATPIPRRSALGYLTAAALVIATRPVPATAAASSGDVDLATAFGAAAAAAGTPLDPVDGDISLADLYTRFAEAPETVARLDFYGIQGSVCVVTLAPAAVAGARPGARLWVRAGYPVESPRSPESPLAVQGKARNAGVPYAVQTPTKFLRKKPAPVVTPEVAAEGGGGGEGAEVGRAGQAPRVVRRLGWLCGGGACEGAAAGCVGVGTAALGRMASAACLTGLAARSCRLCKGGERSASLDGWSLLTCGRSSTGQASRGQVHLEHSATSAKLEWARCPWGECCPWGMSKFSLQSKAVPVQSCFVPVHSLEAMVAFLCPSCSL